MTMSCGVFQAELPDLLYGELEASRREAAESHSASCASCRDLLGELKHVKGALPTIAPPPTLGTRLKLRARDQLIAESAPAPTLARGGTLHVALTGILAACICLAGFGLGIAYERKNPTPAPIPAASPASALPALPIPAATEVDRQKDPEWIEINDPRQPKGALPGRGEAWQRVLFDAANAALTQGDHTKARQFFRRAAAHDGRLTAAAQVGAAEALLRLGRRRDAAAELKAIRTAILAGERYGNAALLQHIAELTAEASGP